MGEPLSERELSDLRLRSDLGDVPLVQSKQSTASPHAQERYRDLVLWKEILDLGHRERRPILFVTGRTGVDWWSAGHGHTRTTRPELIEEYHDIAGERIHICSVAEFLAVARVRTTVEIDGESILEAQSLAESDVMLGSGQQCRRIEALETRAVLHDLRRALVGSESAAPMISAAVDRALERVLVLLASS